MRIRYEGPFNNTGYGRTNTNTVKALVGLGHSVEVVPKGRIENVEGMDDAFKKLDGFDVSVTGYIPEQKKYQALWTVYEPKPAPIEWKYALDNTELLLTMSSHSRDVLKTITDNVIHIVHPGIDKNFGNIVPKVSFPPGPFRFLSVFEWVPRKQGELLLRSFCEAFKPGDKVELWIKSSWGTANPLLKIPEVLKDYPEMRKKVFYIKSDFKDMQYLYPLFDSFVLPVALEGFGITFLEAMACGLKPIGPNAGGSLDFMNKENSYLVECGPWEPIVPFGRGLFSPDAQWRVPLKADLIEKMREAVIDNRKLPEEMVKNIRSHWNWEETAKSLIKELKKL
jgi:glycosyltransferase involved in cell wall biosynthesis